MCDRGHRSQVKSHHTCHHSSKEKCQFQTSKFPQVFMRSNHLPIRSRKKCASHSLTWLKTFSCLNRNQWQLTARQKPGSGLRTYLTFEPVEHTFSTFHKNSPRHMYVAFLKWKCQVSDLADRSSLTPRAVPGEARRRARVDRNARAVSSLRASRRDYIRVLKQGERWRRRRCRLRLS